MQDASRVYMASVFQALSHPTRIAILETLGSGELPTRATQERLDSLGIPVLIEVLEIMAIQMPREINREATTH